MKELKLNSEILSKMKLELSRIFKDDEHVNAEILIQKGYIKHFKWKG